jgi:hypothetical protein
MSIDIEAIANRLHCNECAGDMLALIEEVRRLRAPRAWQPGDPEPANAYPFHIHASAHNADPWATACERRVPRSAIASDAWLVVIDCPACCAAMGVPAPDPDAWPPALRIVQGGPAIPDVAHDEGDAKRVPFPAGRCMTDRDGTMVDLESALAAIAAEREACAKALDDLAASEKRSESAAPYGSGHHTIARAMGKAFVTGAAAIRARGKV